MGLTRREALAGIGGALAAGAAVELRPAAPAARARAFADGRQSGILTPRQDHLTLAAFDLHTPDRADLQRLLADWTALVVALCEGGRRAAADSGEADGLGPRGLTITLGFGAALFDDRYGLRDRRPAALVPAHSGDARLDAGGDLLLQACADDRQVVYHAVHQLANAALGIARPRWTQQGFVSRPRPDATPRNLFGFHDGTANLPATDASGLARHVWIPDGPLAGGTYLAYRRIRLRMQAWDRAPLEEQEQSIGRRKASGARFAAGARAHARAMHPDANGGVRILRRPYNYDDGPTADGEPDAGVAFLAFTADPRRRLGRLLARLEGDDDLRRYLAPTAAAVFAVPPAPAPGEHLGARLLG
jgi:deferrochelatase/peroxidase EfeB